MKYKTTAKAIREGAMNPRCAGYCNLSFLLTNHSPVAYTCGVYGWNVDGQELYGLTICTGYRGMPGKRLEGISEAENKACDSLSLESTGRTYDEKREAVEEVLKAFCLANGGHDF